MLAMATFAVGDLVPRDGLNLNGVPYHSGIRHKTVGDGVCELPIDYGPGYRVYCGRDGPKIGILLIGGDKHTQVSDIETAKAYWADYKARGSENNYGTC